MKPRDIFGIIVRTAGLISLGYGGRYAMSWLFLALKRTAPEGWKGSDYVVVGVEYLVIGVLLLRAGDLLVDFAYPRNREEQNTKVPDEVHEQR